MTQKVLGTEAQILYFFFGFWPFKFVRQKRPKSSDFGRVKPLSLLPLPSTAIYNLWCNDGLRPLRSMRSICQLRQRCFNAHGFESLVEIQEASAALNPNTLKGGLEGVGTMDKQRLTYAPNFIGHVWLDTTCPVPASWCMCGACVSSDTCAVRLVRAKRRKSIAKRVAYPRLQSTSLVW